MITRGEAANISGCKVLGAGAAVQRLYWSEIRGKCVLAGLYAAGRDCFSLADPGPVTLERKDWWSGGKGGGSCLPSIVASYCSRSNLVPEGKGLLLELQLC